MPTVMFSSKRVSALLLLSLLSGLFLTGCESPIAATEAATLVADDSEFTPVPRDGLDEPYELSQVEEIQKDLASRVQVALAGHDSDLPEQRAALTADAVRATPGVLSVTVSPLSFSVSVVLKDGTTFIFTQPRPGSEGNGTEPPAPEETELPAPPAETPPMPSGIPTSMPSMPFPMPSGFPTSMPSMPFPMPSFSYPHPSSVKARGGSEYLLPSSKKAVLVDVDGLGSFSTSALAAALRKKNYSVTVSNGLLAELRTTIRDTGALWISSHSVETDLEVGGKTYMFFAIQTGETTNADLTCPPNSIPCRVNRTDELQSLMFRGSSDGGRTWRWFINRGFMLKYWKFQPASVVVLDICSTMDSGEPSAKMRANLVSVGAHTILGWDTTVSALGAVPVMKRLFDRVLGNNDYAPVKPKQRPFSFQEVHGYLVAESFDKEANGPAKLKIQSKDANQVILVPSIKTLEVDEQEELITVKGEFGKIETPATLGGQPLTVASWSSREIIAKLPRTGAGSFGDTLVDADGRHSNTVPLTRWQGTMRQRMTYNGLFGGPGPWSDFKCSKLTFRADIHRFRDLPGTTPVAGAYGMMKASFPEASKDSTCAFEVGGEGRYPGGGCRTVFVSNRGGVPWSPNVPEEIGLGSNDSWWLFVGNLNLTTREFRFFINDHFYFKMQTWCKTAQGGEQMVSENRYASLFSANGMSQHYSDRYPHPVSSDWSLPSTSMPIGDLNGTGNQRTLDYNLPAVSAPTEDTES